MTKYRVEHEFIYGWDDAGWHDGVTGEPTLYDTYQDALADLEDFIYNENIAFEEGDIAEVDFDSATVRNVTRGQAFDAIALPPKLLDLLKAGGIYSLLEKEGAIGPKTAASG